ncbi:MAG: tRNA (adenosine(37)-N6)-threonylcarbamoyltransferase complex ATPase subunit type 1 TsaE [bacterium]
MLMFTNSQYNLRLLKNQMILTANKQQTKDFGKKIASNLKAGDIVLLEGDLGAGKTTLTKAIANYLNVKEEITSPTFTLMNVYKINKKGMKGIMLAHIDTYRLKSEKDLINIGVLDYLGANDAICIIEWPKKIKKLLNGKKTITIKMAHIDKDKREINELS